MLKQKMNLKDFSRTTLSALVILQMTFPASFAANIVLDTRVNFRVEGVGSDDKTILKSLAVLPKGTVLEVPDEFVIRIGDKVDVNKTLNNWMKQGNIQTTRFDKNGRSAFDHFFPVKVVEIPGNRNLNGQVGLVALKSIAQRGGIKLETIERTALVSKDKKKTYVASSTEAKTCIGDCGSESSFLQKIHNILKGDLSGVKTKTDAMLSSKKTDGTFDAITKNFERTCFGLKFEDFATYVEQEAPKQNIPAELMLGIMTQESAGICHAVGDKKARSKSVGLFQLNTRTAKNINLCSDAQLNALKGKTLSQMASDSSLRCLQNPAINLQAGMKVLLDKYSYVNNGAQPKSSAWELMTLSEKDNFRRALSAYNGGENWVRIAKKDIEYAQRKFGIDLTNDWETMRLFMMRQTLARNGIVSASGKSRKKVWEVSNVAYVDRILGRGHGELSQTGFTDDWQVALERRSTISVATRSF